ncbi:hypothetical protein [Rhodoligotrophos defluvii]|uniref:hypothetical protein n=1 Tax=Rhodoligotrophos defluvii TaxID=2561934 RepID=UPI0010C95B2A|nr:hypothetical protein [Rhodoligotrophos defluvii]
MLKLPLTGWLVAWQPRWAESDPEDGEAPAGSIEVGPWPDENGWSEKFLMTGGCCYREFHGHSKEMQIALMFIAFHTCVVRDGIDPQDAHRAFLNIEEYRKRISFDIDGALQ